VSEVACLMVFLFALVCLAGFKAIDELTKVK
jgi:hypothetical protein